MKSKKRETTKTPLMNALNNKRKRAKSSNKLENLFTNIKTKENELSKIKNIHFSKCIVDDAMDSGINNNLEINLFEIFQSIDNIPYLVYINRNNIIVFYDLNESKKSFKIKNSHDDIIWYIRYYLDEINKRDLILTISYQENNIKIWNVNNLKCIFDLESDSDTKNICSSNFLYNNNQINIIVLYEENRHYNQINIYDLNIDEIEGIKYFNGSTYFLKTYYNKKNNKNYIISGHYNYIISYDYNKGKQYRKYKDGKSLQHSSAIVYEKKNEVKLN